MIIFSLKLSKTKIFMYGICLFALIAVATFAIFSMNKYNNGNNVETTLVVSTNEQKIAYLKSFGWEVKENPTEIIEIVIPKEFNEIYQNYNNLQKKQGFNLEPYKGKKAKRWTYEVTNYPKSTENVRANIIEYNSKIIGGDVCSYEPNGFMHGFEVK